MIGLNEALAIHEILVERFGGAKGTRDMAGLESAINRPHQTFDGQNLYPDFVGQSSSRF
jgi:death on curing protein